MEYACIKSGIVENVIECDEAFAQSIAADWDAVVPAQGSGIGWAYIGGVFTAPPQPDPTPAPPLPRHITRLAFLSRFTDAEAVAIDLASIGATVPAASLRRYTTKVNASTFIDLDREDTRAGVEALEAAGMIAVGRAAVILDGPILDAERYKG